MEIFKRVIDHLGETDFNKLQQSSVAIFGIGGVGSLTAEALIRTGIGSLVIVDYDNYESSNINRQWPANNNNLNMAKVAVIEKEAKLINPDIKIKAINIKITPDNIINLLSPMLNSNIIFIDAIDDLPIKIQLIRLLYENKELFISSMGAANIFDITSIKINDISKTSYCPIAKIIRKALKNYKIQKGVPVVYSTEHRKKLDYPKKGSIMPLTASFGLYLAWWSITKITEKH